MDVSRAHNPINFIIAKDGAIFAVSAATSGGGISDIFVVASAVSVDSVFSFGLADGSAGDFPLLIIASAKAGIRYTGLIYYRICEGIIAISIFLGAIARSLEAKQFTTFHFVGGAIKYSLGGGESG